MQVKKQQLEPDIEQQTGSKLGKEDVIAVYCHPASVQFNSVAQLCPILTTGGRSGGLVVPSLERFSTVCYDLNSQRLWHSQ